MLLCSQNSFRPWVKAQSVERGAAHCSMPADASKLMLKVIKKSLHARNGNMASESARYVNTDKLLRNSARQATSKMSRRHLQANIMCAKVVCKETYCA